MLRKQILQKELADLRLERYHIEESVGKTKLCIEHARRLSVREREVREGTEVRSRSLKEQEVQYIRQTNQRIVRHNSSMEVYANRIDSENKYLRSKISPPRVCSAVKAHTPSSQRNSSATLLSKSTNKCPSTKFPKNPASFNHLYSSCHTLSHLSKPLPTPTAPNPRFQRLRQSNDLLRNKYSTLCNKK